MRRYWTGFIVTEHESRSAVVRGRGWRTVLDAPLIYRKGQEALRDDESLRKSLDLGIYIEARSKPMAQRASDLIWAAFNVVTTHYLALDEYPEPVAEDELDEPPDNTWMLRADQWSLATSGFDLASQIAARCSRSRKHSVALNLLAFSHGLCCTNYHDLDPAHWRHGPAISEHDRDHIRFAYAIVSAYAVLEQLGLEVRLTMGKASRTAGRWEPEIREDLELRLRRNGVDLSEPAQWNIRGTPRRIDRKRQTQPLGPASWKWGRVRDVEVEVVDAIADLSWLRSKVSSHALDELAQSLTPYDVANGQYLARRLLLASLGLSQVDNRRSKDPIRRSLGGFTPVLPPGEMLVEKYLKPLGMPVDQFARLARVSQRWFTQVLKGRRSLSMGMARRWVGVLHGSGAFGPSPREWVALQRAWDHRQVKGKAEHTNNRSQSSRTIPS